MPAKPFWQRISLLHINLLLYFIIAGLVMMYWHELRWAVVELPKNLNGRISSSIDRSLYWEASTLIGEQGNLQAAYRLLVQSKSIDPNNESGYWLGRYFFETGQHDQALREFAAYLEIDPTKVDAYLKIAVIFEQRNELKASRQILQQGQDYFSRNMEKYTPWPDSEVQAKYNRKARQSYAYFKRSAEILGARISQLEVKARLLRQAE